MPAAAKTDPGAEASSTRADICRDTVQVPAGVDEICCDGGGGALGHPQVWYSFDGRKQVVCGYCDRVFVRVS